MTDPAFSPAPAPSSGSVTVTLVEPIARDSGAVSSLTLRKPKAGELRGIKLQELMVCDVSTVLTVLPRISDPFITDVEAANLSTEDIAEIAGAVLGFFMTPAQKALIAKMTGNGG